MEVKIIANYLPQFHRIPENDKWWGEGFTDWVSAQKAVPLFEGHRQPRIPLNEHYYSLDDVNEIKWQAELARKYGVYGFGMYHYWFSSDQKLLYKPAELILEHSEIDINFMFIWDNASWIRTWSNIKRSNDWAPKFDSINNGTENGILAQLNYGNESDWEKHFMYLLPFFKDKRYIKYDNKPLFGFYSWDRDNDIEIIKKMSDLWNRLAIQNGLDGIICMTKANGFRHGLEYNFRYAPMIITDLSLWIKQKIKEKFIYKEDQIKFFDYDKLWKAILKDALRADPKTFLSGFVGYDDSPRRGTRSRIVKGQSAEKFEEYFTKLLMTSRKMQKEYVFVSAWNEWGEGAYLEPDTVDGTAYLEAVKRALEKANT